MIHVAVMQLAEPSPEGETEQVFVSLDGKRYVPVNRRPEAGDEAQLAEITSIEPTGKTRPMGFARRAMSDWWWGEQSKGFEHYTLDGDSQ